MEYFEIINGITSSQAWLNLLGHRGLVTAKKNLHGTKELLDAKMPRDKAWEKS